jgi:Tfp pilus assembly protein PilZ
MAQRIQLRVSGGTVADNRRIQTRHVVAMPITLTVDGTPSDCTMLNLSLGGAQVAANTRFTMGQRVQVAFHIPTIRQAIEVSGTVRWSNAEGVGVQFDGLRARDVWALNEYFKQLSH